ncbi:HAMP domain-containing sensor histidine kinase [Sediminicola luteus]|uniref:histidine kinase n=1 Tax=Sediminicola luteus TaxID=319238 RepID=A0A2A4G852_9FLAO|nr:HAMP domain-containing sensor histidine kinase [Sediminicola luteus]PCE63935.1 two-component sensor histidine kinase [Sediminicola luteus]
MENQHTLTPKLIKKLWIAFTTLILLMGLSYVLITAYFANKYNQRIIQQVNWNVAQHVIEEKFAETPPFLEDGSVNKALFGDLMHDMMAVNRGIEVYLLDPEGTILYSVVLDHEKGAPVRKIDLAPVQEFLGQTGDKIVLGDDPRGMDQRKIFSAAPFEVDGKSGYIYIILAGKEFDLISSNLLGSYFLKLGLGTTLLTMLFAACIALLSIWFLTKNLREIIKIIKQFQEGDLKARIPDPEKSDIAPYALSFNEMADTIVDNIEKIQSVDSLRRELIANVSHDLRTPLAIMKGYVETMVMKKDSLPPTEMERYLQTTHDSTERLSRLIDQLFQYSKLEAEQVSPQKEPFSIKELSYDLIAKFKVLAEKKGIDLHLEYSDTNYMVFADVGLVERAIQNLLENALKYTPAQGAVTLCLKKLGEQVEVRVTDTGVGIAQNEQAHIFDRYRQLPTADKKMGSGLGLAIVKKIMDLHQTTITVLSKPQEGSSFVFQLPAYS